VSRWSSTSRRPCAPARRRLILGEREIAAEPITVEASQLTFKIADAPPAGSTHLARLRVDGFDSPIIDRTATPVAYLDRRITLP
jgi:hypothetical protein